MAVANINPAIAKDIGKGNLLCIICSTQVKAKVWIAHSSGRKHRDNVVFFKNRHSCESTTIHGLKRSMKQPNAADDVQVKKIKPHIDPDNSADEPTISLDHTVTAPWENGSLSKITNHAVNAQSSKIIEGVPEGFFEDEKLNKRVVETIEKEANMEREYASFMKEIDRADLEGDEKKDTEEFYDALEHEIDVIDEQIDHWKRVNHLELRRDELLNAKTSKTCNVNGQASNDEMDDGSDDEIDWRCKGI